MTNNFKKPIETAKFMRAGDKTIVRFESLKKLRAFTVMLSNYNTTLGRERNVFVHSASHKKSLQCYLVATTVEERNKELENFNLKGEWKRQIAEKWMRR